MAFGLWTAWLSWLERYTNRGYANKYSKDSGPPQKWTHQQGEHLQRWAQKEQTEGAMAEWCL